MIGSERYVHGTRRVESAMYIVSSRPGRCALRPNNITGVYTDFCEDHHRLYVQ